MRCIVYVNMQAAGGAEGNRTPDLLIANEALSQLSYSPAVQAVDMAQGTPTRQPTIAAPLLPD